jgi:redox-sensing transcriptional repressor
VSRRISETTVRRLSLYLRSLEEMERRSVPTASSQDLAGQAGTTAAQVRKDLSLFGSFGKRGLGYEVQELADRLRDILGLDREWRVALVGAGRIGSALFEYAGFRERGFRVVAVLDADPRKIGRTWGDVRIRDTDELEDVVREERPEIVILAVPASAGQPIVDRAVRAGVRGVLNFAPAQLRVPDAVALQDVNLVMELEALSFTLRQGDANGGEGDGHVEGAVG